MQRHSFRGGLSYEKFTGCIESDGVCGFDSFCRTWRVGPVGSIGNKVVRISSQERLTLPALPLRLPALVVCFGVAGLDLVVCMLRLSGLFLLALNQSIYEIGQQKGQCYHDCQHKKGYQTINDVHMFLLWVVFV